MSFLTQYGLVIVAAFMAVEILANFILGDTSYDGRDTATNLSIGIVSNLIGRFVWTALGVALFGYLNRFAVTTFSMNHWTQWALAIVLADLAWYFEHRTGHEVRLGWAVHSVHHSSETYNYSVALRLPWLGGLMRLPFLAPMALLGFSPAVIYSAFSAVFIYQVWLHTEYVPSIPGLEAVLNTPSLHRVHHARNPLYIDKNYGGIFMIWDHLFGTYQKETESPEFGITKPLNTHNPVTVNFAEMASVAHDVRAAKTMREKARAMFGKP